MRLILIPRSHVLLTIRTCADRNAKCKEPGKAILLGSSNSWFPTALSALAIPRATDKLGKIVEEQWTELSDLESLDDLHLIGKKLQKFQSLIPLFSEFQEKDIWAAIEARRREAEMITQVLRI